MFRLRKNLTLSIAIKLLSFGLAMPTFAVITKILDPTQASHWFIVLSIVPVFLLVVTSNGCSLTNSLSKEKLESSNFDEFRNAVINTKIISIRLIAIFLAVSVVIGNMADPADRELYYGAGMACLLFLFLCPIQLIDSVYMAKGKLYKIQISDLAITLIFLLASYISIKLGSGLYTLCVIYPIIYYSVRLIGYAFDDDAAPYISVLRSGYLFKSVNKLSLSIESKNFIRIGIFNIIGTSLDLLLVKYFTKDNDAVMALAFFQRLFLVYSLIGSGATPFWPYLNFHIVNGSKNHAIKVTFLLEAYFLLAAILISWLIWVNGDYIKNLLLPGNLAVSSDVLLLALLTRTLTLLGEGVTPIMQTRKLVGFLAKITVLTCSLSLIIKPFVIREYGLTGLLITNSLLFGVLYLGLGVLSLAYYFKRNELTTDEVQPFRITN